MLVVGAVVHFARPGTDTVGARLDESSAAAPVRLAVLPFEDLSLDREGSYLSTGITDELVHALSRIPQLAVIGSVSSSRADRGPSDPRRIGEQLDAGLLVGRCRSSERGAPFECGPSSSTPVPAEFVGVASTNSRSTIFSRCRRRWRRRSLSELQLELAGSWGAGQPTAGRDGAYELYLRGRYEWSRRTEAGIWKAIEAFRAAIAADPEFARAYAGLADAYRLLPAYGNVSGPEALRLSMSAALRAVELDDTLAESHAALAASYVEAHHDRALATREYLRAIEINPNEVTALRWYGLHLAAEGDFEQAAKFVARARELDPLSHVAIGSVGTVQYFARRFDEAIHTFGEALALSPDWATGHAVLGRVYLAAGRPEEALATLRTAVEALRRRGQRPCSARDGSRGVRARGASAGPPP